MKECRHCKASLSLDDKFCSQCGAAAAPYAGQVLANSFELVALIGTGGLGTVWKANDLRLKRAVAVKILRPTLVDPQDLARFAREAQLLGRLDHPSIVPVFDVGESEGGAFMVMRLIEGPTLKRLIEVPAVRDVGSACHFGSQAAEALRFAHSAGIIHRDVKPSNILVDLAQARAMITDFGIAKARDDEDELVRTRSGHFVGTISYCAPEQMTDEAEAASDVYSLGLVVYELATGIQLFAKPRNQGELFRARVLGEMEPAAIARLKSTGVDRRFPALLARMLSSDPRTRPTAEECASLFAAMRHKESRIHAVLGTVVLSDPDSLATMKGPPPIPTTDMAQSESTLTGIARQLVSESPTGEFTRVFRRTGLVGEEGQRFQQVQDTLAFYREQLRAEYDTLLKQARVTFWLWLVCVGVGFAVLAVSLVLMLTGKVTAGAAGSVASLVTYFLQRSVHTREDHYRSLAASKNEHLEYGNQWWLVVQSIDGIDDEKERATRQSHLVEILSSKLRSRKEERAARKSRQTSKDSVAD